MNHQLSDSRADVVSDSTAELIRLGETTLDRLPTKAAEGKVTSNPLLDSTSGMSAPSAMITGTSQEASRVISDDAVGGMDIGRSILGSGRSVMRDAALSQRSESAEIGSEYTSR